MPTNFVKAALGVALVTAAVAARSETAQYRLGTSSFESKCALCHNIDKDAGHAVGPNLGGVIGRKVGSASGFSYSPALARSPGDWDASRLDAFLKSPQAFAPGNVMPFAGLKNDKERKAVICFLSGDPQDAACAM